MCMDSGPPEGGGRGNGSPQYFPDGQHCAYRAHSMEIILTSNNPRPSLNRCAVASTSGDLFRNMFNLRGAGVQPNARFFLVCTTRCTSRLLPPQLHTFRPRPQFRHIVRPFRLVYVVPHPLHLLQRQFRPPLRQFHPSSAPVSSSLRQFRPPLRQFRYPLRQFRPPLRQFRPPLRQFRPPLRQFRPHCACFATGAPCSPSARQVCLHRRFVTGDVCLYCGVDWAARRRHSRGASPGVTEGDRW